MKTDQSKFGWRVKNPKLCKAVSFYVFIPSLSDQWQYDLKITKKGLRKDGMRFRQYRRTLKAGGIEIETIVLVVFEPELTEAA
jgi:hypothetical protein